jgi:hypothetical protein
MKSIAELIEYLTELNCWVKAHETVVWYMGLSSVLMFFGTLLCLSVIIVMLPKDYFLTKNTSVQKFPIDRPVIRIIYIIIKNIVGFFLILAGMAMLVLPGQGLLSLLIGISISSFPGKRRLIRIIIRRKAILKTANWLRRKTDRPPLEVPIH